MREKKQLVQQNKFQKKTRVLEIMGNLFFKCLSLYCLLRAFFFGVQDSLQIDWWDSEELSIICIGTAVLVTLLYDRNAYVILDDKTTRAQRHMRFICSVKELFIIGIFIGIFLEIYFARLQFLVQEFFKCFYHTIPLVNAYYQTEFPIREVVASENPLIFLRLVAIVSGLLFGLGISFGKKCFWSFFPLLAAFAGGFFLGCAPGMKGILYLLCGFGSLLLTFSPKESFAEKSAKKYGFVALILAVGISALIYKPASEKLMVYHESWDKFQTTLEDKMLALLNNSDAFWEWFWKVGGREERACLTNDPPKLTNEEIFTITVEHYPREAIYVKDFVGVSYDKGVWYPEKEWGFLEFLDKQKEDSLIVDIQAFKTEEKGRYIQEKGFEFSGQWRRYIENVKILTKKRTGNLSLQLYGAAIPKDAEIVGDSGIRMDEKAYEFQRIYEGGSIALSNFYGAYTITDYFDYRNLEYDKWNSLENMEDEVIKDEWMELHAAANGEGAKGKLRTLYAAYVREAYTQIPTEQLQNIINNWTLANDNLLQECTYSFHLEPVPAGKDVVEYFVLEQKKGYCMHFASAYALMLRMQGIPTRYVGGYMIPPKDFQKNEDGTYTAVVTGQRAHAWVEYYDEYYGWNAYETTPAAYYTGMMNLGTGSVANLVHNLELWAESNGIFTTEKVQEALPENEKDIEKELSGQEDTVQEAEQTEAEEKNNNGQNLTPEDTRGTAKNNSAWNPVLKRIAKIAGILAAVVMIIWLRGKWIFVQRKKRFTDTDTQKAAKYIVKETFYLLELTNIRLNEQQNELDFAKETEHILECLKEGEFVEFVEIARIARYGSARITKEQVTYLHEIYQKIKKHQMESIRWYQKLWHPYLQ